MEVTERVGSHSGENGRFMWKRGCSGHGGGSESEDCGGEDCGDGDMAGVYKDTLLHRGS